MLACQGAYSTHPVTHYPVTPLLVSDITMHVFSFNVLVHLFGLGPVAVQFFTAATCSLPFWYLILLRIGFLLDIVGPHVGLRAYRLTVVHVPILFVANEINNSSSCF